MKKYWKKSFPNSKQKFIENLIKISTLKLWNFEGKKSLKFN